MRVMRWVVWVMKWHALTGMRMMGVWQSIWTGVVSVRELLMVPLRGRRIVPPVGELLMRVLTHVSSYRVLMAHGSQLNKLI